jgi:G3E family GTPase
MSNNHLLPVRQLNNLLPPSVLDDPVESSYELVRAVLIRSTYIPGVRHTLGWRGIHEVVTPGSRPGSITAKINHRPGVFALHPVDTDTGQGSRFSLSYFPSPEEDLVESFSIEAGIQALAPDFLDRVRQFSNHPDLTALFHIGFVESIVDDRGIFLSVSSCDRLGWVSEAGIEVQGPEGPVQAVEPGGVDQDVKARELTMDFFSPLAASVTYTLGSKPSILYTQKRGAASLPGFFLNTPEHRQTMGWFCEKERGASFDWENTPMELVWERSKPIPKSLEHELWWTPDLSVGGKSLDKKAMGITDKPRFILLTGFLGSGKTSFLEHFIQFQTGANHFVAVVQNEIGEKGLDAKLLGETYAVTEMDEGCVCCSLAGNLRAALSEIMDRFQPDFIVLETTGLANPANILGELNDLRDILEFCSITTLVDSRAGNQVLDRFEVARDQVRLADVILVNKEDLAEPQTHEELENKIQRLNPTADIHRTIHGDIHPGLLYGVNFRKPVRRPLYSSMEGNTATHEKEGIETRLLNFYQPLEEDSLLNAIREGGENILRVKGIVEFSDQEGPMVLQYAPGTCRVSEFTGKDKGERFLVIIGRDLDSSFDCSPLSTINAESKSA